MHMWVVKAINTLTHLDVRRLRKLETSASICWSFHVLKAKERPDERFLSWHELSLSEGELVTLPLRSASCCHVEQECDDEGLKADAERGWAQRLTGTCQRRKMKKKKDGKLERWKAKERGLWMWFFVFVGKKQLWTLSLTDSTATNTHAHSQAHTCSLWTLYMAITMATKCTERSQRRVFLSFKAVETTMETAQRKEETGAVERRNDWGQWKCTRIDVCSRSQPRAMCVQALEGRRYGKMATEIQRSQCTCVIKASSTSTFLLCKIRDFSLSRLMHLGL